MLDNKLVPGISQDLVPYQEAGTADRTKIETLMAEIDVEDTNSIIFFGAKAQEQLTTISDNMLDKVKSKDVGPAGGALSNMVTAIRGFDIDELDPNRKQGFFERLFNKTKPIVKFLQRYEEVRKQIDMISIEMEKHKTQLLTDITSLDRLYEANLDYFHTLELYITAGEELLRQFEEEIIPAKERAAKNSDNILEAQQVRDLHAARDDLERRVHDLKLTRQVTMQSLPSIRLVQENDKSLITKINSTLVNTVPLWRQQLAQAVTIHRSGKAAKTVKAATDLTNELLMSNAANLKQANREVRQLVERGVFDIETVKKANKSLIETIEESVQIAEQGRENRRQASTELVQLEDQLKQSLIKAKDRASKAHTPAR
ncbi:MAG: toxic anion resistance protein [Gammaproteobacteria bacterium]|nr:toxic anion resistance protein [Gammaproteobacteria bacterium]